MKKDYKIIASDLDGTLFDAYDGEGESTVSEKNLAAIEKITKLGASFVIATGRTLCELPKRLTDCLSIRYIICSNGAAVIDRKSCRVAVDFTMTQGELRALFDLLSGYEAHITVRSRGTSYVDAKKQNEEGFAYYNVDRNHAKCTSRFSERCELLGLVPTLDSAEDFSAYFHNLSDREAAAKGIAALGLNAVFVGTHGLEIFNKRAGKGAALLALAEAIGVKREETVGIGDSGNDLSLIKSAGLGLAVENATEELKAAADETVCHYEMGVADYILKRYF